METPKIRFIQSLKRTPTVGSFRFEHSEKMNFSAGQFLKLIFNEGDPADKQLNKYLSFSSSPIKKYIEVTKRLTGSDFSQKLSGLKPGDLVAVQGPLGSCILNESFKKIAFVIGGIGITPAVSIIEYVMDMKKYDFDIALVYSNRSEEEIAFKSELDSWQEENRNLKLIYTVTDCQPNDKRCIFGRINTELLLEQVPDLPKRRVFIFGPARMVEDMQKIVKDTGVPALCVEAQSFVGY